MLAKRKGSPKKGSPKRVLRLPDLDHSKRTVLDSLGSPDSARAYAFAMNDFIAWYCSEPRLAFSKHVVLRYRIELESRRLSASTINLRPAAVRRLAFEAADSGLLSPELAAGIPASQRSQETRGAFGKLADRRSVQEPVAGARRTDVEGPARSGDSCHSSRLRFAPGRGCQAPTPRYPAAGGTLGSGRFDGQGPACPYCACPRLGQGSSRRMDSSGRRRGWASLSVRESQGLDLGQRHHRKGHLAHCESQRKARRHSTTRAPRLSSLCRMPDYAESQSYHVARRAVEWAADRGWYRE